MVGRVIALFLVTLVPAQFAPTPAAAAVEAAPIRAAAAGFEVTITGGPHAGSYKGSEAACFLLAPSPGSAKEFEVAFSLPSSADPRGADDPKVLDAVRIHVYEAEKTGPVTQGFAHVIFGPEKKPRSSTKYEVRLNGQKDRSKGAITLAVNGRNATAGFEGHTDKGVGMSIKMNCTDLMNF